MRPRPRIRLPFAGRRPTLLAAALMLGATALLAAAPAQAQTDKAQTDKAQTDNRPSVQFAQDTYVLVEDDTDPLYVNVTITPALSEASRVKLTASGSGTRSVDYTVVGLRRHTVPGAYGTVSHTEYVDLPAGATSVSIKLRAIPDKIVEHEEPILFELTSIDPANAPYKMGDPAGTEIVILDDSPVGIKHVFGVSGALPWTATLKVNDVSRSRGSNPMAVRKKKDAGGRYIACTGDSGLAANESCTHGFVYEKVALSSIAGTTSFTSVGCRNGSKAGAQCLPQGGNALSDNGFVHGGVAYRVHGVTLSGGTLTLTFDRAIPASLKAAATLTVGGSTVLRLADATHLNGALQWGNTGLSWSVTDPLSEVSLRLAIVQGGEGPGSGEEEQRGPLTAAFEAVPGEHDGQSAFTLQVQSGSKPAAAAFKVTAGKVKGVESLDPVLWRVRVAPTSWKDVTVALGEASATVPGPARIRVADARAKEGKDASLDFAVTLSRAASGPVTVDYATADGTAAAGADYTATSGTLTFAPGETEKTVSVALLDDAIDEGKETFKLELSNPRGAYLRGIHREAEGTIRNDDPLQQAWLGRFGRAAASDAVAAVTARFETPRGAGSHFTLGGQRLSGDGAGLAHAMTGLARAFGAEEAPATTDDPWNDPTAAPARSMSTRELLLGTSFRAVLGSGAGSQLTSWGQGASVSHFSGAVPGLTLSGESATGALGMDYERGALLAGFAMTHSLGAGTAHGAGETYAMGSSVTTMLPYARFALTERISAWGLAGTGAGGLTLDLDDAASQRYRTDLSMTLAAAGVRGDLLTPSEPGGLALALKADAFWVRTESDALSTPGVGNLAAARADATRLRAVLDGSRTFALAGGATLAPSVALGVRHDGGDAATGTGLELGAGLGFADPSRGLDMALRVYGLAAHAEDSHREWGVSGSLRLVPGAAGRGLSMSLTPSYGADPGGSERLWALPDAHALAANGDAPASSRLDTEFGYGLPVFGGGFTGTPNVGLGLSDTARDYRLGWRLTPAAGGDTGFELSLDAMRRESAENGDAEHGVMLRARTSW